MMKGFLAFCFFLLFPCVVYAVKPVITVNIDNPRFRRLVVALPHFEKGSGHSQVVNIAEKIRKEVHHYLSFSGMFSVMDEKVYGSIKRVQSGRNFEGFNINQWKSIGVESLVVGKVLKLTRGYRIELRAADVLRGSRIVEKSYIIQSEYDVLDVAKRFVDRMLQAYTGKPGIFSSRVVFVGRKTRHSSKQVYTCDVDGRNVRQLTFKDVPHLSPSWSPDGKKILFTSYEQGNPDLYILDRKSLKSEKISGHQGINSGGQFASAGKLIAFTGSRRGNAEIFITDAARKKRKPLLIGHGIDVDPTFSPDGKWLAFVSGRFGNPHIFKAKLAWNEQGTHVRIVEDKRLTYAGWYNATPSWSPDSKKIAFAGYDREINRFDLFVMNHDGSALERLTMKAGDNEAPSWSPNGQLIIYHSNRVGSSDIKGSSKLYVMNRDGSGQRVVETGLYDAQTPKWGGFLSVQ